MSLRYLAGYITESYNPLKVPNAPTITSVTPGNAQLTVAFTAPSNVGASAITSYISVATKTSDGTAVSATGSASPITITGLTNGSAYTIQVCAVNTYGPGPYSAPSGSVTPYAPKLFSWGTNNQGQLGQGDTVYRSSPVQVGSDTNWAVASPSIAFTVAIKTTGTMWSVGANSSGQLGLNNRSSGIQTFTQIGALTTWATVGCGVASGAVKTDGTLWTWGTNFYGPLGQNDKVYRSSPTQVGALTNWSKIIVSGTGMFAIKTDGTLWAWGSNSKGQLGQNNVIYRSSPVQIGALTNWAQVSSVGQSVAAIKTDGTLWAWGENGNGQLGDGTVILKSSPVQIGALTTWSFAAMSQEALVALKTDGTLWSCGYNQYGQLGTSGATTLKRSSPVQIGSGTTWNSIAPGGAHYIATTMSGEIYGWGRNDVGQLGINTITSRSAPTQIGSNTLWVIASCGEINTFAISG